MQGTQTSVAADLPTRFTYHAPTPEQVETYQSLRSMAKEFAEMIADRVPGSREQALALTKLEECVFWANAGIARRS